MIAAATSTAQTRPRRERAAPLAGSSRLPWFAAPLCQLLRVAARGKVGSFRCGESTWHFRWMLATPAAVDLGIRIGAGAAKYWIGLPRAHAKAFPADAFDERVPPAIRAELLKAAAAPMWTLLEQILRVPVRPLDVGALGSASSSSELRSDALTFALEKEGGEGRIVGSIKPENAAAVRLLAVASAALIARDDTPFDYPVELRLAIGTTQLEAAETRGLEAGDTILLEHRAERNRGLIAAVRAGSGMNAIALVECGGHGARILETWLDEVRTMDRLTTTLQDPAAPQTGEQRVGDTVMALQVPLRFEIGWRTMRLSELCAIRPGEVLDLEVAIESAQVTILCGSDTIGTGQLVAIGDRLGVRVLDLPQPAPAPAGEIPLAPAGARSRALASASATPAAQIRVDAHAAQAEEPAG